jgi:hypothetical protein
MADASVELLAWARINDQTEIEYSVCAGRTVELTIGGSDGLTVDATERGMLNLLAAVAGALQAFQAKYGSAAA